MADVIVNVQVDVDSTEDVALYLEHIAGQVRQGFIEGISEMDGRGEWQSNLAAFDL